MKNKYIGTITFKLNEPFDVNYVNNICKKYPNSKILVEVQNTKGITSSMIRRLESNLDIRIAGGYDKERLDRYGKDFARSSNYYINSVIYTKNETIKLLEEMEKVESGIFENWSQIQKIVYIYDRLKREIMYDPKYEYKTSSEIRSLRGLLTKKTVCAGYAFIFKEFMDRNNINCEYVEGSTHCWNIINIGGKKYPIDLTWDNTRYRSGKFQSMEYLAQDVEKFSKSHTPFKGEKTQDYIHTLSQTDPKYIELIYKSIGAKRAKSYESTTYYGTRTDGSKYIVAQTGSATVNDVTYYRYYYVGISKEGKKDKPLILYSKDNITKFINYKDFNKPKRKDYKTEQEFSDDLKYYNGRCKFIDYALDNLLFSKENIQDSLNKHTFYIGSIKKYETKASDKNKKVDHISDYIKSVSEIKKEEKDKNLFAYPTRRYKRSDGSVMIIQQTISKPFNINGFDLMQYEIFELVKEDGKEILKRNCVYTEKSIFENATQDMIDDYLSRSRLDRKVKEAGGYIGYYDENGTRRYNPSLVSYFETSKRLTVTELEQKDNSGKGKR